VYVILNFLNITCLDVIIIKNMKMFDVLCSIYVPLFRNDLME